MRYDPETLEGSAVQAGADRLRPRELPVRPDRRDRQAAGSPLDEVGDGVTGDVQRAILSQGWDGVFTRRQYLVIAALQETGTDVWTAIEEVRHSHGAPGVGHGRGEDLGGMAWMRPRRRR